MQALRICRRLHGLLKNDSGASHSIAVHDSEKGMEIRKEMEELCTPDVKFFNSCKLCSYDDMLRRTLEMKNHSRYIYRSTEVDVVEENLHDTVLMGRMHFISRDNSALTITLPFLSYLELDSSLEKCQTLHQHIDDSIFLLS